MNSKKGIKKEIIKRKEKRIKKIIKRKKEKIIQTTYKTETNNRLKYYNIN